MKYEINKDTGLPEVPEGFYFRVCEGGIWDVQVSLMRKAEKPEHKIKTFFGFHGYADRVVDYKVFDVEYIAEYAEKLSISHEEAVKKYIIFVARSLLDEHFESLQHAEIRTTINKYMGTYPPKNINEI